MLVVRPLGPSGPALAAWCGVYCAGYEAGSGTAIEPAALARQIRSGAAGHPGVPRWAAWRGRELVGAAQLAPGVDAGFLRLYVEAGHRRHGVGGALYDVVREYAAAPGPRGRPAASRLRTVVNLGGPGERFAARLGGRVLLRLVVMAQRLSEVESRAVALPPGFRLLRWRDGVPEPLLAGYAEVKRSIADAPDARLQLDPHWYGERVRAWERSIQDGGGSLWACAAASPRGRIVAFTEVEVGPARSGAASQHGTGVLPAYRGAGLATAVKTALAQWLRAECPEITGIVSTINAENGPMLAVCRRLGYHEQRRRALVEFDV